MAVAWAASLPASTRSMDLPPPEVMEARLDTLLDRIEAEEPLRRCNFTHDEIIECLEDQNGHVGKSLNRLRERIPKAAAERRTENESSDDEEEVSRRSSVSAPPMRRRSLWPDPSAVVSTQLDSLDTLLTAQQGPNSLNSSRSGSTRSRRPSLVNFSVCTRCQANPARAQHEHACSVHPLPSAASPC